MVARQSMVVTDTMGAMMKKLEVPADSACKLTDDETIIKDFHVDAIQIMAKRDGIEVDIGKVNAKWRDTLARAAMKAVIGKPHLGDDEKR